MNIFFKDTLTSSDQLHIKQLLSVCTTGSADNTGSWGITPAPADILDADGWWFSMEENGLLSGCMAVYQTDDDSFECVPFIQPDLRRKGIFSSILAKACEEGQIPGNGTVYFSCGNDNGLWKNVLHHIGAEHVWDEYMMERKLLMEVGKTITEETTDAVCCQIFENASANEENIEESESEGSTTWRAVGSRRPLTQNAAQNLTTDLATDQSTVPSTDLTASEVTCFLVPQGDSIYLYSLEVLPELRNKHLGTAFLSAILPQLAEKGFKTVKLQVSSKNLPAMSLYKKTEFHITQTLSFYEY